MAYQMKLLLTGTREVAFALKTLGARRSTMANSKEQERAELHRTIWNIANDLRGSVDGWDFKQYVLGMLFYRYISENITAYINAVEHEAGDTAFDYAKLSDSAAEQAREDLVKTKGFFMLPGELFENVHARAKDDENLNETLESIFNNIEASAQGTDSEDDFKGLFDDIDVNSNKLGGTVAKRNELLVKLMNGVGEMKLGDYQDNTIDAFGDAYEFLMGMYASSAGKSGGEYYTPQEVSELLTHLTLVGKTEVNKVYDPACGSGSLLLKFAKILGKENVRQGFFGQETNITTYNLCRINMFLHDIDYDKFDIAHGDTLTDPLHWDDEPFEAIVSNPPYSIKWKGDSDPILINDPRFSPAGVLAPKSKADLAFIMHSLSWLATSGTAAIVCFPGVMYRGGAEQKIRQYLIDNNYIDCVIQLPDNLFYGTSIATCIMVLKKSKAENSTLFIDASKECVKVTNNNKLTQKNIDAILDAYTKRADNDHFAVLVPNADIAAQGYNLSVSTYVEQEDTREVIDIVALNAEIEGIVAREQVLRDEIAKIIAEIDLPAGRQGWAD
jgi:type I restriction enzyme M protein